jgi:hypothetical protein
MIAFTMFGFGDLLGCPLGGVASDPAHTGRDSCRNAIREDK